MGVYLNGKLCGISLPQSGGGDIIIATNLTGNTINAGDKVWIDYINNNWIIKNSIDNIDISHLDISGDLSIVNGIASNFSSYNFIYAGNFNLATCNSWYFETEITIGDDIANQQAIFVENRANFNSIISILSNGIINVSLSQYHSSWDIGSMTSTTKVPKNTPTKIKLEFTGSAYKLYINNILENTITSNNKLSNHVWNIGCSNTNNSQYHLPYISGTINLNKTKVFLNETYGDGFHNYNYSLIWPNKNISENIITGIATENIENSELGSVKTVLPN